jgi:hypothetical protein
MASSHERHLSAIVHAIVLTELMVSTKMELLNKQVQSLFPTPIFTGNLSDITACDRIEQRLREMQRSGQGVRHSFADFAFITSDDIHY